METIGTFDDVPLTLLDIDIPSTQTARSNAFHNARGRPACSIELHITAPGPANLVLRVLGQNQAPISEATRLVPLTLAVPNLSALTGNYDVVFLVPMYTAYMQVEIQSVSGAAVHVTAYALGSEAGFDDEDSATGELGVGSAVTLGAGSAVIGHVIVDFQVAGLPAGTNNIGDVDVLTLPALPAGTNNIGDVDVLTLPALPAGANSIGAVTVALPTVPYHGAVTVVTATTRVQLASTQALKEGVDIEAHPTNLGLIYVGGVTVTAANGRRLAAGQSVYVRIADLATMYIDASVSGEGASYIAT